jgi:hypothetical protein
MISHFKIQNELLRRNMDSRLGTRVLPHCISLPRMRLTYDHSERKWKEKLKEWKFDKNISAADMSILVAKAAKRMHNEGKRTVFFLGESQITRERIEQFKRRKLTREIDDISAEAGKCDYTIIKTWY